MPEVHMQGDPHTLIMIVVGMVICFIISAIPITAVIIFLVKYYTSLHKNDAEMYKRASEIKEKQLQVEANEANLKKIVTCPYCGKQSRYGNGQCKYCGGVLKLDE
jgi:hypothetical protein